MFTARVLNELFIEYGNRLITEAAFNYRVVQNKRTRGSSVICM